MVDFLFNHPVGFTLLTVAKALALLVPLLLAVAMMTLAERKIMAAIQAPRPLLSSQASVRVRNPPKPGA